MWCYLGQFLVLFDQGRRSAVSNKLVSTFKHIPFKYTFSKHARKHNLWRKLWRMLLSNILESGSFYFIFINLHSFIYHQTPMLVFSDQRVMIRWLHTRQCLKAAVMRCVTGCIRMHIGAMITLLAPSRRNMIASLQPRGDPPVDGHRCHFIIWCNWDLTTLLSSSGLRATSWRSSEMEPLWGSYTFCVWPILNSIAAKWISLSCNCVFTNYEEIITPGVNCLRVCILIEFALY